MNGEGYTIMNWIALLLHNRTFPKRSPVAREANQYILSEFLPDISGYDVIYGANFALGDHDLFVRDMMRERVKNNDPRLS